ncbi:MAG: hypothetical protein ABIO16_09475 [Nocardioides sp.]
MTTPAEVSAATVLVAVDTRSRDLAAADHAVHRLEEVLGDATHFLASTHLVPGGDARVVLAAECEPSTLRDPADLMAAVREAFSDAGVVVVAGGRTVAHGPVELVAGARDALDRHRSRSSGRLVRYPGQEVVESRVSVGEVLDASCIDEVTGLAGTDIHPQSELDLTGFARPTWTAGRVTLLVQPAVHALIPFEVRDQVPCCSHH